MRRGALVDDRAFDVVYPPSLRRLSSMHWTPVEAALRAAKLLAPRPDARVLDVGSGVGKFCIVAAASVRAEVVGIEHRARLVDVARRSAASFDVDVTFVRGTIEDCDPGEIDGVYLFNPFAENLCSADDRIDETVELSESRFVRDVAAVSRFLRATRPGTRVVTYCGFGGQMPEGYALLERRHMSLELWEKRPLPGARAR